MNLLSGKHNEFWNKLSESSRNFEQTMDPLYKKQTGSYYTSLELTYLMMENLVSSLDNKTREKIYIKTFFEPCVGTGNFVFAYLRVCQELNFTKEQYKELLNNIYVCDINNDALLVYQHNLIEFALIFFGIPLDDNYFNRHTGNGLLFDVNSENIEYISIKDIFPPDIIKNGFDFVVTNPPYKNLKAEKRQYKSAKEYNSDRLKYTKIATIASYYFSYSTSGIINLYKLFVEEILERYLSPNGVCSLLIPASILSDKTCTKIRSQIIDSCAIKSLHIIPENNSYVNASQSLCAILLHKGMTNDKIKIIGSVNSKNSTSAIINVEDIIDKRTGNAILVLSSNEYCIRKQMLTHPSIKEIDYIDNLRGELDLTLNKKFIQKQPGKYMLLRGRNISYYNLIESKSPEFVDVEFVKSTPKQRFIFNQRLVCQQIVNMTKKRRISFSLVPENCVLGNSCNFIYVNKNNDGVDIFYLLGILNSSLIDWYFKLTSSNNHINNYEIDNFPIPIHFEKKHELSALVQEYLVSYDEEILDIIDAMVYEAYGIPIEGKKENIIQNTDEVTTIEKNSILNDFFLDLRKLIPYISIDDCKKILSGKASILDIRFQKKPIVTKFEKEVLEQIEIKYKELSCNKLLNHTTFKLSNLDLEMIQNVPQGGNWKNIPYKTIQKSKRLTRITQTGGRTTLYGRIDYSMPSYTITTYFNRPGNGTYVHPLHQRVISVREAARFQTFPDNYLFCGNKSDMLKQVGNAVPVILAYNLAKSIREKTGCHKSVDLFSGAGGMTYGFKCAGIEAVISNDIDKNACLTLKVNSPEIPVLCGDITDESVKKQIIRYGIEKKADIICGGPPCQGFSLAGFRMEDDPRNELFRYFVDIVSKINPKIIVFENVEGILSYNGGETYQNIIDLFSELGYKTEGRTLYAHHYGVPQKRKRVIILCTHKDMNITPRDLFPEKLTSSETNQITAKETIYDLESIECSENAIYTSNYSSDIIDYFRGRISINQFVDKITPVTELKNSNKQMHYEDIQQLSLF